MKAIIASIIITISFFRSNGQAQITEEVNPRRWPISIYLPEYGKYISLTNDINLGDTITIKHSELIYFRFVFYDSKGASYCEIYKKNKLYQSGNYANSLDTLKTYTRGRGKPGSNSSVYQVKQYFEPLKDGVWQEFENGRFVKKRYTMGIELSDIKD